MARKKETEDFSKQMRWEAILRIVSEQQIGTQKELAAVLLEKGFDVTQATLSRDIRDLHLVKTTMENGGYGYKVPGKVENHPASSKFYTIFEASVTSVETAMNQVVIHTYTGMAQAVCAALDGMAWDNVLGTIAGDDTILAITRNEESAMKVAQALRDL